MGIKVTWYGDEFSDTIRRNAVRIVNRSALLVQREAQRLLSQGSSNRGATPSRPGSPPHKDTGTLARSITVDLAKLKSRRQTRIRAATGTRLKYAAIHEFGGTIVPRTAKALLVPIGDKGRKAMRSVSSVRELKLSFIKRKGGKPPLLARNMGDRIEPLFVMTKRVVLPPRPYMRPALAKMTPKIRKLFSRKELLKGYRR